MWREERARTYRRRAEEMRNGAQATTEIAAQDVMMRLAAKYDTLARKLEMRAHPSAGFIEREGDAVPANGAVTLDWNQSLSSALSSH